jgi:Cupin-like domain
LTPLGFFGSSAVRESPVFRLIPIPEVDRWQGVPDESPDRLAPVVVRELFANQAKLWSPARLAELWPDREVRVSVDLPSHSVPYRERHVDYHRTMSLSEFIELLESGRSCYLAQTPLSYFPELYNDLNTKALRLGIVFAVNVWVGNQTRSGLHYDNADNLFGQIYGRKRAQLVSPKYSRYLYPFSDNPSKSQVDLDSPDLERHPRCTEAEVWYCDLGPGDALYMPRGWWHHIRCEHMSLSVNCWFGDALTQLERVKRFLGSGAPVVLRTVYDFLWHGLLRKPYQPRLFSPPPPGVEAYMALRRRLK